LSHIAAMVMQPYMYMRPAQCAWHQCMHIIGSSNSKAAFGANLLQLSQECVFPFNI